MRQSLQTKDRTCKTCGIVFQMTAAEIKKHGETCHQKIEDKSVGMADLAIVNTIATIAAVADPQS